MALAMEELHIWLIIIKIMEHNKAPSKQLIKDASRSWCKRIWLVDTKLTFAKTRWKSPCNALWKNPTYIYLWSRMCLCFFHRKKMKSGRDVKAADTEGSRLPEVIEERSLVRSSLPPRKGVPADKTSYTTLQGVIQPPESRETRLT